MNRFYLIIVLFFLSFQAFSIEKGQKEQTNFLSVGTGYSQFRMIDRKVSTLPYSSSQSPNYISFLHISETSIFRAELNFEYSFVQPVNYPNREFIVSSPNHNGVLIERSLAFTKASLIQDELNIEYLRLIKRSSSGKLDFYFGGLLKQYFSYSSTQAPVLVFSELSLNPDFLCRYYLRNNFESQTSISLPLLSLITRMPYSNDPTDGKHNYFISTFRMGSELSTLNRYQRLNYRQTIQKKFSRRWSAAIDYNFYWFCNATNSAINAYDNSLVARLLFCLNSKR
jgi:hypothetical protein